MNHVIVIAEHAYAPAGIRISAGDTITWENRDTVRHTATRRDQPAFDTGPIVPGGTSTPIAFPGPTESAGIGYFCTPHPFMRGTIIVDAATWNEDLENGDASLHSNNQLDHTMNKTTKHETKQSQSEPRELLARRSSNELVDATETQVHRLGNGIICATDYRAGRRSRLELVLDATEGFIPLWAENLVLRWKFNNASLVLFQQPEGIKTTIRNLLGEGIAAWGHAIPIRFTEESDNADFEIAVEQNDSCTPQGCTLAQAFFPDAGRHQLFIFPKMFTQTRKEQVDTLTHEIGHVFGLRHFFAPEFETPWPSVIFGEHKPFSIMNYGVNSELTDADREDLKTLYENAWNGRLTKINGTPIKLVRPYHYSQS